MKKMFYVFLIVLVFAFPAYCWRYDGVQMPELQLDNPYAAATGGGFNICPIDTAIEISSSSTLDVQPTVTCEVYVYGEESGVATLETLTLNGDILVTGEHRFDKIYTILVVGNTPGGNITVSATKLGTSQLVKLITSGTTQVTNAFALDGTANNFPTGAVIETTGWNRTEWNKSYRTEPFCMSDQPQVIEVQCSNVVTPIAIKYQISNDNANWIDGAVAFADIDNVLTREAITEPLVGYIRMVLDGTVGVTPEVAPTVKVTVIAK